MYSEISFSSGCFINYFFQYVVVRSIHVFSLYNGAEADPPSAGLADGWEFFLKFKGFKAWPLRCSYFRYVWTLPLTGDFV
jgi:hypothetical protein